MARRSSIALAGVTTILSITTGTDAFSFHHHGKLEAALHVRQQAVASSAILPVTYTSFPTAAGTGLPSGSLIPTVGASTPSYNDSTPVFPMSTVQEAIGTVCPGQPADSGIFTILSDPTKTISATAVLANGSKTTFASTSAPASAAGMFDAGHGNARIEIDGNGCQTLFAPRVTAICSTTVSLVGIPEVAVTDCEQWVTFSSDTKICSTTFPQTSSAFMPLPTTAKNPILDAAPSAPLGGMGQPSQPAGGSAPSQPSQPSQEVVQSPVPAPEPEPEQQSTPDAQATLAGLSTNNILGGSSSSEATGLSASAIPTLSIPVIPVPEDTSTSADPGQPTAADASNPPPSATDTNTNTNNTGPGLLRRQQPASITSSILAMPTLPSPNGDEITPGTYYAAHWYDIARGGVPPRVRAVECELGGTQCTTYQEQWSVSSVLRTITETKAVSYSGAVVVTDGPLTYTTTISIATSTTTTRSTYMPTVIKKRVGTDNNPVSGGSGDAAGPSATAAAAASAGVFAGQALSLGQASVSGGGGGGGDDWPESTTTLTGTITVTNTVYQGVTTSFMGAAATAGAGSGTGTGEAGEVGSDGVRTIELVSV